MPVTPYSFKGLSLDDVLVDMAVRFILNCPDEDLLAFERFFFQVEEAHWFYEDFARVSHPALPHFRIKNFVERLFEAVPILKRYIDDPMVGLAKFKSYKSLIPVRGGIILNEKMDKVLMVQPWRSKVWVFPRGKINKNESDEKCAIREVLEETGFDMSAYLNPNDFIEVTRQNKNIRLYVVKGVPMDTVFETQTRKEISEIKWHSINNLPIFSRKNDAKYQHAVPFLHGLKQYIATARGEVSQLSAQETNALKNLLGVTGQLEADEASAQRLLSMLQAPPAEAATAYPMTPQYGASPSTNAGIFQDQQVVKDLFNSSASTKENIECAEQILELLQHEIATEQVMEAPAKIVVPPTVSSSPVPGDYENVPPVPPNSMLQSLVTSRKGNTNSGLLSVLGGERPEPRATPSSSEGSNLLSLLKTGSAPEPVASKGMSSSGRSLMSLLKGPEPETFNASSNLMNLLQPPSDKSDSQPLTPAAKAKASEKGSLMSLLQPDTQQKPNKPATEPKSKEATPAANHLMDLLGARPAEPRVTEPHRIAEPPSDSGAAPLSDVAQQNGPSHKGSSEPKLSLMDLMQSSSKTTQGPGAETPATHVNLDSQTHGENAGSVTNNDASASLMALLGASSAQVSSSSPPAKGPAPAITAATGSPSLMALLTPTPSEKTPDTTSAALNAFEPETSTTVVVAESNERANKLSPQQAVERSETPEKKSGGSREKPAEVRAASPAANSLMDLLKFSDPVSQGQNKGSAPAADRGDSSARPTTSSKRAEKPLANPTSTLNPSNSKDSMSCSSRAGSSKDSNQPGGKARLRDGSPAAGDTAPSKKTARPGATLRNPSRPPLLQDLSRDTAVPDAPVFADGNDYPTDDSILRYLQQRLGLA